MLVKDALALPELPTDAGVTLINSVPSAMAELVRIKGVPASVKTVNLAGEPLSTALVNSIYALGTVEQVNDLYGPSEDTTYSTWTRREANALPTIGRPIYNTQAYLLDKPADMDRALKALRRKYGWQMAIGDCFSRLTGKMKRRQYIRVERPKA